MKLAKIFDTSNWQIHHSDLLARVKANVQKIKTPYNHPQHSRQQAVKVLKYTGIGLGLMVGAALALPFVLVGATLYALALGLVSLVSACRPRLSGWQLFKENVKSNWLGFKAVFGVVKAFGSGLVAGVGHLFIFLIGLPFRWALTSKRGLLLVEHKPSVAAKSTKLANLFLQVETEDKRSVQSWTQIATKLNRLAQKIINASERGQPTFIKDTDVQALQTAADSINHVLGISAERQFTAGAFVVNKQLEAEYLPALEIAKTAAQTTLQQITQPHP